MKDTSLIHKVYAPNEKSILEQWNLSWINIKNIIDHLKTEPFIQYFKDPNTATGTLLTALTASEGNSETLRELLGGSIEPEEVMRNEDDNSNALKIAAEMAGSINKFVEEFEHKREHPIPAKQAPIDEQPLSTSYLDEIKSQLIPELKSEEQQELKRKHSWKWATAVLTPLIAAAIGASVYLTKPFHKEPPYKKPVTSSKFRWAEPQPTISELQKGGLDLTEKTDKVLSKKEPFLPEDGLSWKEISEITGTPTPDDLPEESGNITITVEKLLPKEPLDNIVERAKITYKDVYNSIARIYYDNNIIDPKTKRNWPNFENLFVRNGLIPSLDYAVAHKDEPIPEEVKEALPQAVREDIQSRQVSHEIITKFKNTKLDTLPRKPTKQEVINAYDKAYNDSQPNLKTGRLWSALEEDLVQTGVIKSIDNLTVDREGIFENPEILPIKVLDYLSKTMEKTAYLQNLETFFGLDDENTPRDTAIAYQFMRPYNLNSTQVIRDISRIRGQGIYNTSHEINQYRREGNQVAYSINLVREDSELQNTIKTIYENHPELTKKQLAQKISEETGLYSLNLQGKFTHLSSGSLYRLEKELYA